MKPDGVAGVMTPNEASILYGLAGQAMPGGVLAVANNFSANISDVGRAGHL